MKATRRLQAFTCGVFLAVSPAAPAADSPYRIMLVDAGKPRAVIVQVPSADAAERTAVAKLQAGILRDAGASAVLPLVSDLGADVSTCILAGTARSNLPLARMAAEHGIQLDQVPPEGFRLRTFNDGRRSCLLIAGGDARGVLYGVQEALDQVITSTPAGDVYAGECDLQAAPALGARGTYCLTCWGGAPRYDRAAWEAAIDSMAEAGMNRVMFWMDGLFRSNRHPGAFLNRPGQHYAGAKLTTDDVHGLSRFAHDRGMEFFLGSGVFAWFSASEYFAKQFPKAADHTGKALCPSKPLARWVTLEYLSEMIEVFPEADGYMLEIRDEMGDCECLECRRRLDAGGSRQFGQSEMDFLEQLTAAVWKDYPRTKFIWLIGYANHAQDAMYYERMRKLGQDPRMEWLDARDSWTLPTPDGKRKPLREFSDRVYHWDAYYKLAPEHMQGRIRKTVSEGLSGYLPAYEPGFANVSLHDTQAEAPFPVDQIPFCLTQYYYRTFTWNPKISQAELLDRAHRKFFTAECPRELAEHLLFLRQFITTHHTELTRSIGRGLGPEGSGLLATVEDIWTVDRKGGDKTKVWLLEAVAADIRRFQSLTKGAGDMARVKQIEGLIDRHEPTASRRSQASLQLMRQAIDQAHSELAKCGQYVEEADEALARIDRYLRQIEARNQSSSGPASEPR